MATDAANKIDYVEFQARDLAATRKFFEALFGWTFTDYGPDYSSFEDGRIAGGFFTRGKVLDDRQRRSADRVLSSAAGRNSATRDRSRRKNQRRYFFVPGWTAVSFHRTQRQRMRDLVGMSREAGKLNGGDRADREIASQRHGRLSREGSGRAQRELPRYKAEI
jgi:catechol 2,3-dioxygenase-like lactoylglutathione lyase family enzyme